MRPYLCVKKRKSLDGLFTITFLLGTALAFLFAFLLSAILGLEFSEPLIFTSIIILSAGALAVRTGLECGQQSKLKSNTDSSKSYIECFISKAKETYLSDIGYFLAGFVIFTIIFLIAVYIKGFKPEVTYNTEKYMDYGFVNTIYRQKTVFPMDIWFSGKSLNYYYLGHACAAYLCRLASVTPEYGYNFMLCTIVPSVALGTFTIAEKFIRLATDVPGTNKQKPTAASITGGIVTLFLCTFAGNFHYVIYGIIQPLIEKITGMTLRYNDYGYFFPDSTTYIGYNPDLPDKGKNEFPAYSFVLGDLHAHVINLMFVIPLIYLLLDYVLDDRTISRDDNKGESQSSELCWYKVWVYIRELMDYRLILVGVLLGLFRGTNYWDFPIYFVVAGGLILFTDIRRCGINAKNITKTMLTVLAKGAVILIVGTLVIIPFTMNFDKMASTIKIAQNHSQFYKLIILWGFQTITCAIYFIYRYIDIWRKDTDLCLLALSLCALGLVIVPELIYVEDIYGLEYARFNTMFKLTYQAFVIFAICIGIMVGIWINENRRMLYIPTIVVTVVLSTYMVTSVHQFMGNIFDASKRKGCSGTYYMYEDSELFPEAVAAKLLMDDDRKLINVLEVSGDSYSPECKLSVVSGSCTVVGWQVHEWMWRGDWAEVGTRVAEVNKFYTSGDIQYCSDFIDKYNLDYIFVGPREMNKYDVRTDGFEGFCEAIPIPGNDLYALYKVVKKPPVL